MHKVTVKSKDTKNFSQELKAGSYSFTADVPVAIGGVDFGPNPHELLLGALGACTSITLQMYAKKKEMDLKHVTVILTEDTVDDSSNPGTKIARFNREIAVQGNLTEAQIQSLKEVADRCMIHKLLEGAKEIKTTISQAATV